MTRRLRLLLLMSRPPVALLLGIFAAVGLAQANHSEDRMLLIEVLAVVVAYLLFSVLVNDLADEAIDRVNLPDDARRALVGGTATRTEFAVMAAFAAAGGLAVSASLGWPAFVVAAAGLLLSASYSVRPVRLADRGALASLVLPGGYVAVPYLVAILGSGARLTGADLALLGSLYVGFIGRILLKDFRDVRGDALFGKRTFLVRHGRRWTCRFSAGCWVAGSAVVVTVRGTTAELAASYLVFLVVALGLLRALSDDRGPRRDEALISAVAIVGRGMIVTLLAHLSMRAARWPTPRYAGLLLVWLVVVVGQAAVMARRGPRTRLTVPAGLAAVNGVHDDGRPAGALAPAG